MHGLLQRVRVACVALPVVGSRALLRAVLLLCLWFVLRAALVHERAGAAGMRASWVYGGLSEGIRHILLARVARLVDEGGAGLLSSDVTATASWVVAGRGRQATEPAGVELFGIGGFLVATGEALGLRTSLNL